MITAYEKGSARGAGLAAKKSDSRLLPLILILSAIVLTAAVVIVIAVVNSRPLTTEQVAQKICPCIVGVVQYQKNTVTASGEGSGIVFRQDGYIVTNNHVVDGSVKLEAVMSNGKRYTAKLIGTDARTDLAVIKIEASGLKTAEFGDSSKCCVGQQVVAVGNPTGLRLAGSVTQGIISATGRTIDVGNGPMKLIQTDAAINPGNSGGALVNMRGQVIGINSAKIAQQGYEGIGFSIPIASAKPVVTSIMSCGYVKGRVKFGMSCRTVDEITAVSNGLPAGVYVTAVDEKGSAAKSGVKPGDIITAVGAAAIKNSDELIAERDKCKPGTITSLTIYRRSAGETMTVWLTLMEDRGASSAVSGANW